MIGWWTRALAVANAGTALALAVAMAPSLLPPRNLPPVRPVPTLGDPVLPRADVNLEPALLAPIFNPDRSAVLSSSTTPQQPLPAVVGVMAHGSGAGLALVRAEGKQQLVRVGAEIGGWRLLGVAPRHATFARGTERHDVKIFAEGVQSSSVPSTGPAPAPPSP